MKRTAMSRVRRRPAPPAMLLAATLAASSVVAACGGTETGKGAGGADGGVRATGGQAMVDAQTDFARCMREQGVDFPDPRPGGGFELDPGAGGADERRLETAERACRRELEAVRDAAPQPSADELATARDATLRLARCLRRGGQDVPDPRSGTEAGGTAVTVPPDAKRNPAFAAAQRKCEHELRGLLSER